MIGPHPTQPISAVQHRSDRIFLDLPFLDPKIMPKAPKMGSPNNPAWVDVASGLKEALTICDLPSPENEMEEVDKLQL